MQAAPAAVAGQPVSAGLLINPLTFFWDERWVADEGLRDYLPIEATARYRRLLRDRRTWRRLLTAELDLRSIAEAVLRRTRTTVGATRAMPTLARAATPAHPSPTLASVFMSTSMHHVPASWSRDVEGEDLGRAGHLARGEGRRRSCRSSGTRTWPILARRSSLEQRKPLKRWAWYVGL